MASRNTADVIFRKPRRCLLRASAPHPASKAVPRHRPVGDGEHSFHGGIRTSVLTVLALGTLAAVVVIVLARSLGPPEPAVLPAAPTAPDASRRDLPRDDPEIAGTITLAADLEGRVQAGSVLFVIARKAAGPPFAVKRIVAPRFPLAYRLGPEDVMMAGSAFEGEVRVSARLSRTGRAGPAETGDLEGDHPAPVRVGARGVDIVIFRVR